MSAKRSQKFSPRPASERGAPSLAPHEGQGPRWAVWLGLAWLLGFCLFFYTFTLPNNREWNRFLVWFSLFDFSIFEFAPLARWGNLAQRGDLVGVAAILLAGAWSLGHLSLRLVCPQLELRRAERTFFAMSLGLGATSLVTLALGLAGCLYRGAFVGVFVAPVAGELFVRLRERGSSTNAVPSPRSESRSAFFWTICAAMAPFLFVMWLGSMSPETDFDVKAYHFEGPKEYFLAGRITFLSHNMYASFPSLTEMLTLAGMVVYGDWFWGALAGKCVLFSFAPLTALGLYAAGRRWFSEAAGLLAALVYLSSPWMYRISIIAYVEGGLAFFLFASLFAAMIAIERLQTGKIDVRQTFLVGLLAGSAMACKYTGVMQVVAPIGIALVAAPWFVLSEKSMRVRAGSAAAVAFTLGVVISIGPWLIKNVVFTGNPVFPLAYSIFGGADWNSELNARFVAGHAQHHNKSIFWYLIDVIADNDWCSPLWYALAPLALFVRSKRRIVIGLWIFVGYLFFTWWAFTHTIDRFWVPMIPVVSLLAGVGASWRTDRVWRYACGLTIALAAWFNLGFIAGEQTTYMGGYNAFLSDLARSRELAESRVPPIAFLNKTLPTGAKVLCVGEGQVFDAKFPVVYETVFNPSIFEDWFAAGPADSPHGKRSLKPAGEILEKLHHEKVTHLLVDWDWVRSYRSPGNYGFTDFVTPARFEELIKTGVLGAPTMLGALSTEGMSDRQVAPIEDQIRHGRPFRNRDGRLVFLTSTFQKLTDEDRANLKEFGRWLLTQVDGHEVVISAQIFPVR